MKSQIVGAAWRHGLDIASRTAVAVLGGYLFSYAFTAALARLLPLGRADAVVVATLISFLVYGLFIVWVFSVPRVRTAWLGMLLALPLALIGFGPQLLGAAA